MSAESFDMWDPGSADQIMYIPDAANVRKGIPKKTGFSPVVNNLKYGVPTSVHTVKAQCGLSLYHAETTDG